MKQFLLAVLLGPTLMAQTPAVDFEKQKTEILQHFRALVQLNTSPPGNETIAVEYLKKVLEAEGIPTQTFALKPERANLVARLKGNGSKRPLLILAHTDVVGVQREKWPVDPFAAVMKDGYIWGRGTRDDKPLLAATLMTMLLLKRSGVTLDRDVIFLAEAAEEADTTGAGASGGQWAVWPRIGAKAGRCPGPSGSRGGKGGALGAADAAERHHPHLLRKKFRVPGSAPG